MLIGINIAIEQPAHPDAVVAAKRDIAAQRRLEIDTGSGDRVGNLAVEQTCPVIGFEKAGVAGRRLIEIGAVGRPDCDPALPSATLLTSMEKGVYRDRKSVVQGKSVSVRVALGGGRIITKKKRRN